MKNPVTRIRVCPVCGRAYTGHPAMSRTDNETPICPDCGIREALAALGVPRTEQEHILAFIHQGGQEAAE